AGPLAAMSRPTSLRASPASPDDFADSLLLLDRLEFSEAARENLAALSGLPEEAFGSPLRWAAQVEVLGTALLLTADGGRWEIQAPAGADEAEAMLAARRIHGMLGEKGEGWDLDR